jgi:F-type H+-transporting ATPase subunit epsilon
MAQLELEIVTPRGVALREKVDEVVAPGDRGEFGVLPGHLPMLAALNIGLLHYRKGNKVVDVAVGDGFAEILHDKALVLTDRFTDVQAAKGEVLEVRRRLKEVDAKLERWDGPLDAPERLDLVAEEQWLAVKLELIGDPPPARVLEKTRPADIGALIPDEADEAAPAEES